MPPAKPLEPVLIEDPSQTTDEESVEQLWTPEQRSDEKVSIDQMLLRDGIVDAAQLAQARPLLKQTPRKRIGQILIDFQSRYCLG